MVDEKGLCYHRIMLKLKKKKKPLARKINEAMPWQKRARQERYIRFIQQAFLYIAIFMAGYIVGMVQTLL